MSSETNVIYDSSADDEYDDIREAVYEYKVTKWFSYSSDRQSKTTLDEKESFYLSLLEMDSRWKIEPISARRKEFSVKRRLEFYPGEQTSNWSITINVSDMIIGDNRALGREKIKVRGPHKEFLNLTATNENPFVEFEYDVKETEKMQLFTNDSLDYYCNMHIKIVDCNNLSAYLNKGVDFIQPFPVSNVILEVDDEKRVYFVLEALALQSLIFYKFLEEKETLPKEGNHYVIKMEDTDLVGIIYILKLLTYKENNSLDHGNIDRVVFMAKKWKFEMILVVCEEFLISTIGENCFKWIYLSQQYDMSQLQHMLWERQVETEDNLKDLEYRISHENPGTPMAQRTFVRDHRYLDHITAEKFDFPEILTTFTHKNFLKFKPGADNVFCVQDWIMNWRLRWKHNHQGNIFLSVGPMFPEGSRSFAALNWCVNFVLTVTFNGKQRKYPGQCSPQKRSCTLVIENKLKNIENTNYKFTLKMEIKSMKGLRYFVNDSIRTFDTRKPSSDVVLKCGDKKLFANIRILALHSDFFKAMIDHLDMQAIDPKEKLPIVTVETANAETVSRILNYIYNPIRKSMKSQYVMDIIPFAEFYIFSRLLNHCEQILIDSQYYKLGIRTIDYAIEFNLHSFKDEYLRQFKSVYDLQKVKEDPNYQELSNDAKLALYETIMELPPL